MKYFILFFSLLVAQVTYSQNQNGFPTRITNKLDVRSVDDREYRILKEGHLPSMSFSSFQTAAARAVRTAGQSSSGITLTVTPGCALYNGELVVQSDRPILGSGFIRHGNYTATSVLGGSVTPLNLLISGTNTYKATLPQLLYEGAQITIFTQHPSPYLLSDSLRAASITAVVNGTEFTNHHVWNAKKVWLNIGDSMSGANALGNDASGNRYMGKWHYSFVGVDSLITEGKITRLINRHFDSGTSTNVVEAIRNGVLDDIPFDLLTILVGFNDANSTVSSTFTTNLTEIIKWRDRQWNIRKQDDPTLPKPTIILIAPPVTDKVPQVTNITGYRNALIALAQNTTWNDRVYLYNASTAFALNAIATADVNFATTERVAAGRVHPSGLGSTLIGRGLYTVIKTTPFYTNF